MFCISDEYLYKSKKNGMVYKIIAYSKIKDWNTREWIDGVIYTNVDDASQLYVRKKEDFHNRFEKIKKEKAED